jgi:type II secretory ATPase GspE/PulE/Tfp pilus assembly ATPase PilB-like protein
LTDKGVEPFLLSSSLLGVLAQRLVRAMRACKGAGCGGAGNRATRDAPAYSN